MSDASNISFGKFVVVTGAFLAMGAGLFKLSSSEKAPKPSEAPVVAKTPEPPPPPAPQPESAVSQDVANALLGLDKKPEPTNTIAAMEERARELKLAKAQPRRKRERKEAVDETSVEPEEETPTSLSDADFRATIERWRGVKSCVGSSKKRNEGAQGALRLSFTIATSGEVIGSKVIDDESAGAKLIAPCVERQMKNLKFPTFSSAQPMVKEAKFVF